MKTGGNASEWKRPLLKGGLLGSNSVLGHFVVSICFLYSLLLKLGVFRKFDLYNYANDNTAGLCAKIAHDMCCQIHAEKLLFPSPAPFSIFSVETVW